MEKQPSSQPNHRRSASRSGAGFGRLRSKKYVLLERVGELLKLSRSDARRCTRTVLHSLRDQLPHDVLVAFGKQLPPVAFGINFQGWQPSNMPVRTSLRQLLTETQAQLPRACVTEPISVIRAVLTAAREHIGSTEIEKVKRAFPQEMHGLFDGLPSTIRPCRNGASE